MFDVLRRFLSTRFLLTDDMAAPEDIRADVEAGIPFRGTNLWVLIFAILVASVGLNVNSTAVIIGAMLISPLMGPIVGIGFGAATTEVELIQRGTKSLLTASMLSLLVSALYFRLTPLTDAGSELLARTTPTTWDVLIALFGGAAGAVALTRKDHSNAIPGVAIATALMPPLCTAGYGLATAHWAYLFGALYLFSINCVFIALATFLVCRVLPLPRHAFDTDRRARRVKFTIWTVALLTAAPSVYLAVGIVRNGTFTHNAQRFVDEQLNLPGTFVVTSRIIPPQRSINVLLAGQPLSRTQLRNARARLARYRLARVALTVRQGLARLSRYPDPAQQRARRRTQPPANDGGLPVAPGPIAAAAGPPRQCRYRPAAAHSLVARGAGRAPQRGPAKPEPAGPPGHRLAPGRYHRAGVAAHPPPDAGVGAAAPGHLAAPASRRPAAGAPVSRAVACGPGPHLEWPPPVGRPEIAAQLGHGSPPPRIN